MKIEVTLKRTGGDSEVMGFEVNPKDPAYRDRELQIAKALTAAGVFYNAKFGEYPGADQLSYVVVE